MKLTVFISICFIAAMPLKALAASNNNADTNQPLTSTQKETTCAIDIILEDHQQIKKMAAELEKALSGELDKSRAAFQSMKEFLIKHETMEQKVWYPELEKHVQLKDMVKKIKDEEENVSAELQNLEDITDDNQWKKKVKNLIKDVKNHAKNEESNFFPKVKKVVDRSELNEIGTKLQDYKKQQ